MATKTLAVLGPDYCLVRTRTAILLALVAANCGRRVLVTEAPDSLAGLALSLPANLAQPDSPNRFVVAGIPQESLQIILPGREEKTVPAVAEKFAREHDLFICCCDDDRSIPAAADAKVLVAGYDGLMLEEAAQIHKRHPDAAIVVATALPNDFSHKFCLVRASAILPKIAREAVSLPAAAGSKQLLPYSADDSPELWHNSQLLLNSLFPEEKIALGKTVKYGREIVRSGSSRQEAAPAQEIAVPELPESEQEKPKDHPAPAAAAETPAASAPSPADEAADTDQETPAVAADIPKKHKRKKKPAAQAKAEADSSFAPEPEQPADAGQQEKEPAPPKQDLKAAETEEAPPPAEAEAEEAPEPAEAAKSEAKEAATESAAADSPDADGDKFKAPKITIRTVEDDQGDQGGEKRSLRQSMDRPNITVGLIDYEAAYKMFVPTAVLEKQVVAAQNKMNVKVPYAPNSDNLTKGFGELISSVKRIPEGAYGQERRLCCGYLALQWAKQAGQLKMYVLEKSLREFATVQFSLAGKHNLFPWLLAALWLEEIHMVEGKHERVEKSLTEITKRVTEISGDDYEESALNLIPAMLSVVLCKAARLCGNKESAAGYEQYARKHIKNLIPAHSRLINLEMLDSERDSEWRDGPKDAGISDEQVGAKVGKAKESFGKMAN